PLRLRLGTAKCWLVLLCLNLPALTNEVVYLHRHAIAKRTEKRNVNPACHSLLVIPSYAGNVKHPLSLMLALRLPVELAMTTVGLAVQSHRATPFLQN